MLRRFLPDPRDAVAPFAAAGRFGGKKVVAAGAGMSVDDAKGCRLCRANA